MESKEIMLKDDNSVISFQEPSQFLSKVSNIATCLSEVVEKRKLYANIQGKKFVTCEGWTTLASLCGFLPSIENLEITEENGVLEAKATAVLMRKGDVVARAIAFCRSDEHKYGGKAMQEKFEVASMAQTRAVSKVCRIALSWIMTMAGYEVTPAEEVVITDSQPVSKPVSKSTSSSDDTVSDKQIQYIHTLLDKAGILKEHRHELISKIIEREVESVKDLTKKEATKLIEILQKEVKQ